MKKSSLLTGIVASVILANVSLADETAELIVDGQSFVTEVPASDHHEKLSEVKSGWVYRTIETQALQMDDFDNPAFVFVEEAEAAFETAEGSAGKSCSSCHSDVEEFAGLRASLPRVEDGQVVTLEELVNECRTDRMGAEPWKYTKKKMASMVALIGLQSRGMPVNVKVDGDAAPFWEQGKELYNTRFGQLNMACTQCHDDNYGNNIRADRLSQGQINGFPTYRLKNAKMNSAHGRFSGCMKNIRAQPFKAGSPEFKALELYLSARGNGLSVETPSVRN